MESLNSLLEHPPIILVTGGALIVLLVGFAVFFFFPGIYLQLRIWKVCRQLKTVTTTSTDLDLLPTLFEVDNKLKHAWSEFKETLHEEKMSIDGVTVAANPRATVTADSYFNSHSIVDGRLSTEFFRHLPGVFTGIGIIGTFLGLINGLQKFRISEEAVEVRGSLEALLGGVHEAFLISAAAITIAMVVTLLEKLLLTSLYRSVDDIARHLDSLFTAGAGEEYLSRLVIASEDSASQSKILKDSLVGDLRAILQELTERQIAAQAAQSHDLGRMITTGIESSLEEPLKQISEIVNTASGDQSKVAAQLLTDVMASFSQQLNELFGGQISGIQELNQKSAQAMQDAVSSLNALVGTMEQTSRVSGETMADRMAQAVEAMERRQAEINAQTQSFIEGIRQSISTSQSETHQKLNETIGDLHRQVGEMISALQSQSTTSHEAQQERERKLAARTEGMVSSLGDSVASIVQQMAESTKLMQTSIAALERTTATSIDKLTVGATTIEKGAHAFSEAGTRVTGAMQQAATVASKMTEVSGSLTSSATALQSVVSDYRSNREATSSMLTEVRSVVEAAKREASMTKDALDRIQTAATKLSAAQLEAEQYLDGVSSILKESQDAFANGLSTTLQRSNTEFHEKLSSAVRLLSTTIQELEASLSDALPAGRR